MSNKCVITLWCVLFVTNATSLVHCLRFDETGKTIDLPEGGILALVNTASIIECAALCRQNLECQNISLMYNNNGSWTCTLFRPYVFGDETVENGTWVTYALHGICECESGWTPFGSTCYRYVHERKRWADARDSCGAIGSVLSSITSSLEDNFVKNLPDTLGYGSQTIWLGATDAKNEGSWEWVSGEPFIVDLFPVHEPDGSTDQNFLGVFENGEWFDDGNEAEYFYVCEKACIMK